MRVRSAICRDTVQALAGREARDTEPTEPGPGPAARTARAHEVGLLLDRQQPG